MIPYILIFWATYRDIKIPASAEFDNAAACTGALFALRDQGMTGICLPKSVDSK